MAELNPGGSDLEFAVTKESPSAGAGHGIALDAMNDIYFTGALNVPYDIYVAKLRGPGSVSVPDAGGAPAVVALGPNVPNPFSRSTLVSYSISGGAPADVRLTVYDASGRLVQTLVDGVVGAGPHSTSWDGRNAAGVSVPTGVYFYQLEARGTSTSGRMLLVR